MLLRGPGVDMNQSAYPEVSVIMSVYNQMNFTQLRESVNSILFQSFSNFEFIIYSDGSNEDVNNQLKFIAEHDNRIRLLSSSENNGLAYSLNTCIRSAKGRYIARMDADDISEHNRLFLQVQYLREHPEVAFVGCNAKLIDDKGVWGVRRMKEVPERKDYLRFSPFIHPTIMIRRSVLEYNCYNESKKHWRCEDYELFIRLFQLGYKGCNLQKELFLYRENSEAYKKRKWKYRVQEYQLRKANFHQFDIPFFIRGLYIIRPLVGGLVPGRMLFWMKKKYHNWVDRYEKWNTTATYTISENYQEKSDTA